MYNLYRMTKTVDEVAKLFGVQDDRGANFGEEVYPGYPGLVVAEGRARSMNWGFPLVLRGKQGQKLKPKPVTNAREDKLTTGFWKASFEARRCLVPVSAWAEAEGPKGRMTRTWYSLPGGEPFAVAGLWRPTDEWGVPTRWRWSTAIPRWRRCMIACRLSWRAKTGLSGRRAGPPRRANGAKPGLERSLWSVLAISGLAVPTGLARTSFCEARRDLPAITQK